MAENIILLISNVLVLTEGCQPKNVGISILVLYDCAVITFFIVQYKNQQK